LRGVFCCTKLAIKVCKLVDFLGSFSMVSVELLQVSAGWLLSFLYVTFCAQDCWALCIAPALVWQALSPGPTPWFDAGVCALPSGSLAARRVVVVYARARAREKRCSSEKTYSSGRDAPCSLNSAAWARSHRCSCDQALWWAKDQVARCFPRMISCLAAEASIRCLRSGPGSCVWSRVASCAQDC
jgi:hypothetical protein